MTARAATGQPAPRVLGRLLRWMRARRIPFVGQLTGSECGLACLAMVLRYHGRDVSVEDLRTSAGPGRDGSTALMLLEAARAHGLRGRGIRVELDDVACLPRGTILHWGFSHFVVLERRTRRGIRIVDPAMGRRVVGAEELDGMFTGVALTLEPVDALRTDRRRGRRWLPYLKEIARQRGVLLRIGIVSAIVQLFALAVPVLTGLLVDRVIPHRQHGLLPVLTAGFTVVVLFTFLSGFLRARLLLYLRTVLDSRFTMNFMSHLVELPYSFFQRRSAGDLMMRLDSNSVVREILTSGALSGLLDGALVSSYLVLLFLVSSSMGAVVLALGLLRVGLFALTRRRQGDLLSVYLERQAGLQGYEVQMLAGIETLKASGTEHRAAERWSNHFVDVMNASLDQGRLSSLVDSLMSALGAASPLVLLLYGGHLVLSGSLSLGSMLAMTALAAGFLGPLTSLVGTALQLQLVGSYLDRIGEVLDTPPEQDRRGVAPAHPLRGGIRVEDVRFRYAPGAPLVLTDVSLDVEPGHTVAIVGRSGSGKSTLARLMLGLYPPTAGRIRFDGRDLAGLDLRSVRAQVGVVPQQAYLFGASIRENIALADPDLGLDEVVEAARRAHIHDEIRNMPLGYDTKLGDGGASLSGGQRQRLALARALVRRPAILLLDEATSELDTVTERRIQEDLAALRCTRVVIAHRLSTIAAADLIVVLDEGRVVESGRHRALLARQGLYAELVHSQDAGPETDAARSARA